MLVLILIITLAVLVVVALSIFAAVRIWGRKKNTVTRKSVSAEEPLTEEIPQAPTETPEPRSEEAAPPEVATPGPTRRQRIMVERPMVERPQLVIAGTARDIAQFWQTTATSIDKITAVFPNYGCIIVESNSQDRTFEVVYDWSLQDPSRRLVVSLGDLSSHVRTERIATSRNEYLKQINRLHWNSADYLMVIDLDNLNLSDKFGPQISSALATNVEWDGLCSNRSGGYYDIWALRSRALGCTFDCWREISQDTDRSYQERIEYYIGRFQGHIDEASPWIPCESAFGGLALYKMQAIEGRTYDGTTTCEHVSFNDGLRLFIVPSLVSD